MHVFRVYDCHIRLHFFFLRNGIGMPYLFDLHPEYKVFSRSVMAEYVTPKFIQGK